MQEATEEEEIDQRNVVCEFTETEWFKKKQQNRFEYYKMQGREHEPFLFLGLLDYIDLHKLYKDSKAAFFMSIANMLRFLKVQYYM